MNAKSSCIASASLRQVAKARKPPRSVISPTEKVSFAPWSSNSSNSKPVWSASDVAIVFGRKFPEPQSRNSSHSDPTPGKTRYMALGDYANSRGAADMGVLPDRLPGTCTWTTRQP